MKVAVLTKSGLVIRDQRTPSIGPGQILVKTTGCGVCSGEVGSYKGRADPGDADEREMGHEGSGIVVQVGENVQGVAVNDEVTTLNGRFAEYFVTTPDSLVKLPENVDPIYALGEPVACCVHAGNRFGIRYGDRVAIVGCGFMGLMCLQLADLQGAGVIYAIDPIPWRLEAASHLGADEVFSPESQETKQMRAEGGPYQGQFDVVIEAAGVQSAIDVCGDIVKQHGRIILVGHHYSEGGARTVFMNQWNVKAIDVINGHVRRKDEKLEAMRAGMELMRTGRLVTGPLVTCYDMARAEEAFQDLVNRREGLFKAVITVGRNWRTPALAGIRRSWLQP